tara:strand:+ start:5680 stop:6048 length:369 start_codon:yes stop_codon:yes gene_type:complete
MKLFVGNISQDASTAQIRELFAEFEPILDFHRPMNRDTGAPRAFAFVTLADRETAEKAIAALDGKDWEGRTLRINEAEDRGNTLPPRNNHSTLTDDLTSPDAPRRDDRPIGKDGKKVRYKSI